MNKQTEALKHLDYADRLLDSRMYAQAQDEIQACKEALEQSAQLDLPQQRWSKEKEMIESWQQPAQEPVAWIKEVELGYIKSNIAIGKMDYRTNLGLKPEPDDVPLYTHPAPSNGMDKPLFARVVPWQGLSDDEIVRTANGHLDCVDEEYIKRFARAIEQALKEKNHGISI